MLTYNVLFFKIGNAFSKMQKDYDEKNCNSSETVTVTNVTFHLKNPMFNSI